VSEKVDGEKKKRKGTFRGWTLRALEKAERLLSLGGINPTWATAPRYARAQSLVRAALVAIAVKDDSPEFEALAKRADAYLDTFGGDAITTKGEQLAYNEVNHPDRVPDYTGRILTDGRAVRGTCWIEALRVAWQIEIAIDALGVDPDDSCELARCFLVALRDCPALRGRLTNNQDIAKLTFNVVPSLDNDRDWKEASQLEWESRSLLLRVHPNVAFVFREVRELHPVCSTSELSELLVIAGLKECGYPNARRVFDGRRKYSKRTGKLDPIAKGAPVVPRARQKTTRAG
jgi:hypothetical protein